MDWLLSKLTDFWLYDMEVLSQSWIYILYMIPAIIYIVFFILKWLLITSLIWIPIVILIQKFKKEEHDEYDRDEY